MQYFKTYNLTVHQAIVKTTIMRGKLEAATTSQDTRHSWYNVFTGWSPTGSEVVKTFFYPLGHTCPVQLLFGLYYKEEN